MFCTQNSQPEFISCRKLLGSFFQLLKCQTCQLNTGDQNLRERTAMSKTAHFLISTEVVYLQCCLVVPWLVPCKTAAVSLYAPYVCQFTFTLLKATYRVHVCFAASITCHLHYFGRMTGIFSLLMW